MSNRFMRQAMKDDQPFIPVGQSLQGLMDKAMSDLAVQGDNLMQIMCNIRMRMRRNDPDGLDAYDIQPVAYPDSCIHAAFTDPHTGRNYRMIVYEENSK